MLGLRHHVLATLLVLGWACRTARSEMRWHIEEVAVGKKVYLHAIPITPALGRPQELEQARSRLKPALDFIVSKMVPDGAETVVASRNEPVLSMDAIANAIEVTLRSARWVDARQHGPKGPWVRIDMRTLEQELLKASGSTTTQDAIRARFEGWRVDLGAMK